MKLRILLIAGCCTLLSSFAFAENTWKGEFLKTMPARSNVTEEFCKQHSLDSFEGDAKSIDKDVVGKNGVKASNVSMQTKEMGSVYMFSGTAKFSGEHEGKEWTDTVHFTSLALKKDGLRKGVWYTKDCKGFYKVGPSSEME